MALSLLLLARTPTRPVVELPLHFANTMGFARELADRITSLRYDNLPEEAVSWSKTGVLDTIGVALAGWKEPPPRLVHDVMQCGSETGPCIIFGTSRRISPLNAALVNGVAAHVLDFDNTSSRMGGHVSAVMIPALIAAGELIDASGPDLLLAHVAGFETGARIGLSVNYYHSQKGWHPTATLGVFAVTAACGRLLNLTAPEMETALALSTSLSAGVKANFGTMTKGLHAGECARKGLLAALLARDGYTANPEAFEHKHGFFNVFNGDKHYDCAHALDQWAAPLDIVSPGASYKQYPCCYSTHGAVEAALKLVREHGVLDGRAIARIESRTHPRRLVHTNRPQPSNALDAKFSVQYCVAVALLRGKVTLEDFDDAAYQDPVVCALLAHVHALPYTGPSATPDNVFDAEVQVTLVTGETFSAEVNEPLGRCSRTPIPPEQMKAKFDNCAGRVFKPVAVAAIYNAILSLEHEPSLRNFTKLLQNDTSRVL